MGRGGWRAVAVVGVVGAAGLGVWAWFLAGRSLDVMDQMSSVLSGFGGLVSLVVAVVALIVSVRGSGGSAAGGSAGVGGARAGRRSFEAGDASHARVTLGDHSPIHDTVWNTARDSVRDEDS